MLDDLALLVSKRKMSMPAYSWAPGQRCKQWSTTKSHSATARWNSTRLPGYFCAMRVVLDVDVADVALNRLRGSTLVEHQVVERCRVLFVLFGRMHLGLAPSNDQNLWMALGLVT